MAAIKSSDTAPERRLRSALHRRGVRFRLGQVVVTQGRRIRPDIVFKQARLVVFVDGCFWHGCPDHCRRPGSNSEYWTAKIDRNSTRDRVVDAALDAEGWTVMRFWEHDDVVDAAIAVERRLRAPPVDTRRGGPRKVPLTRPRDRDCS